MQYLDPKNTLLTRPDSAPNRVVPNTDHFSEISITFLNHSWQAGPSAAPPSGLSFTRDDLKMGFVEDPKQYAEMQRTMLLATTDSFIARQDQNKELAVLTIVRNEWPLDGFRWMCGGRSRQPGQTHPHALIWNRWHDALFNIYRETGLQPAAFRGLYPLCDSDQIFWRQIDAGQIQRYACRSFTCIALLDSPAEPVISVPESEIRSGSIRWIKKNDLLHDRELLSELSNHMRTCLGAIFGIQLAPLHPGEVVPCQALVTPRLD